MASTYSDNKRIELITSGEQAGSWGTSTNKNWKVIEECVGSYQTFALTGTTFDWLLQSGMAAYTAGEAGAPGSSGRAPFVEFTGTPGGATTCNIRGQTTSTYRQVLVFVKNSTNQALTFTAGTTSSSTHVVTIQPGYSDLITNYIDTSNAANNKCIGLGKFQLEGVTATPGGDLTSVSVGLDALSAKAAGGVNNTAVGRDAAKTITTGDDNVAIGFEAMKVAAGTTATKDNVIIGSGALAACTGPDDNVVIGKGAGTGSNTVSDNVIIGCEAAPTLNGGDGNVILGKGAGSGVEDGDYNVCIGYLAGDSDGAATLGDKKLVIHSTGSATATPSTAALVYGDFNAGSIQFNGSVAGNDLVTANHTSGSFTGNVLALDCARSSSDAFDFIEATAAVGGSADVKFRVKGDGTVHADGAYSSAGADYADLFEWEDGNESGEDRTGYSVVLSNGKIRIANSDDDPEDVFGVISANPAIVGNNPVALRSGDSYSREEISWDPVGLIGRLPLKTGQIKNPRWLFIGLLGEEFDNAEEWLIR